MSTEENGCMSAPIRKRTLLEKLFPSRWTELPEAPGHYKDCLMVNVVTHIDWVDRLRILVSGRVAVNSKVVCENTIGGSRASTTFFVLPPSRAKTEEPNA